MVDTVLSLAFLIVCLTSGLLFGRSIFLKLQTRSHLKRRRAMWPFMTSLLLISVALLLHLYRLDWEVGRLDKAVPAGSQTPSYAPPAGYQFSYVDIRIPAAYPYERRLPNRSVKAASNYLNLGAEAWIGRYNCPGCHTTGIYLITRPMILGLGPPSPQVRDFILDYLADYVEGGSERTLQTGLRPAQIIYAAAGLASWDQYVRGSLSEETERIMSLMFQLQLADGSWSIPTCWPPLQSSRFQVTTVAALAVAMAPGWLESRSDPKLLQGIEKLKHYLRSTTPPHDYASVWLLWAGSRLPGILSRDDRDRIVQTIWKHQRKDGSWSLRSFAEPDEWGDGSREDRLTSERDFYNPTGDGHMTGLSVVALRETGVSQLDPRIERATAWINVNQRATGRWWTSSLNSDRYHMITYSGTCFALLSLWKCNMLSTPDP